MKIVKYGKGMKLKKGYLTECGCCHTVFIADPTDVEFLWRNDDPVEFPTPTYRTYCPVCGDSRIYQIKDNKKKKNKDKSKNPNLFRILGAGIIFVLAVFAIINLCFMCPSKIGIAGVLCITSLIIIAIISFYALLWDLMD